jgi:hypothetical protein
MMERIPAWRLSAVGFAIAVAISGCVTQPVTRATVGQQLIDLDHARENGQLSNQEYAQLRANILSSASPGGSAASRRPRLDGPAMVEAVRNVDPRW